MGVETVFCSGGPGHVSEACHLPIVNSVEPESRFVSVLDDYAHDIVGTGARLGDRPREFLCLVLRRELGGVIQDAQRRQAAVPVENCATTRVFPLDDEQLRGTEPNVVNVHSETHNLLALIDNQSRQRRILGGDDTMKGILTVQVQLGYSDLFTCRRHDSHGSR